MTGLEGAHRELSRTPSWSLTGSRCAAEPFDSVLDVREQRTSGHLIPNDAAVGLDLPIDGLVETAVAALRRHPHISNVMTHISGAQWDRVAPALRIILDPQPTRDELSPLAENIIDLMCADRGITGRILKSYFRNLLDETLPPHLASRLSAHVACLFLEMEAHGARPSRGAAAGPDNRTIATDGVAR